MGLFAAASRQLKHNNRMINVTGKTQWTPNDPELIATVIRLWNDGKSAGEVGAEVGKSRGAVIGIVHRQRAKGVEVRRSETTRRRDGMRVPRARPEGEKADVIASWNMGQSVPDIALRRGMSRNVVKGILRTARLQGKHVRNEVQPMAGSLVPSIPGHSDYVPTRRFLLMPAPAEPVVDMRGPYSILNIPYGGCKWPVTPHGVDRDKHLFCGRPQDNDSRLPYCEKHAIKSIRLRTAPLEPV